MIVKKLKNHQADDIVCVLDYFSSGYWMVHLVNYKACLTELVLNLQGRTTVQYSSQ